MLPLTRHSLIGLDISHNEIRLLQLTHHKKTPHIKQFALHDLPPNSLLDGKIKNSSAVCQTIKKLVHQTSLHGAKTAIALPANHVITKRIKKNPYLTHDKYETEIAEQLHQHFPDIKEPLYFDFAPIPYSTPEVLLVAARQQQVNDYLHVATEAGLQVTHVDIDTFAFARGLPNTPFLFAALNINLAGAELIIIRQQEVLLTQFFAAATPTELYQQLQFALPHCLKTYPDLALHPILLAGNCLFSTEQIQQLEQELEITLRVANPFITMTAHDKAGLFANAPRLLVSLGLARTLYDHH